MISRFSKVKTVYTNSIGLSSIFTIGDSKQIAPSVKALAVQREQERYRGDEGDLSEYPIFEEEIPQPLLYERLTTTIFNKNPTINVQTINVTALSSSAVFQIGSTHDIVCESRLKHIRQLNN